MVYDARAGFVSAEEAEATETALKETAGAGTDDYS
jgi:hypothetical protein